MKAKDVEFNDKVIDLGRKYGFCVSNPDQHTGTMINIIIDDISKVIGFDLMAIDSLYNAYEIIETNDVEIVEDWIKDHE